jgi:hypothetical protein
MTTSDEDAVDRAVNSLLLRCLSVCCQVEDALYSLVEPTPTGTDDTPQ